MHSKALVFLNKNKAKCRHFGLVYVAWECVNASMLNIPTLLNCHYNASATFKCNIYKPFPCQELMTLEWCICFQDTRQSKPGPPHSKLSESSYIISKIGNNKPRIGIKPQITLPLAGLRWHPRLRSRLLVCQLQTS